MTLYIVEALGFSKFENSCGLVKAKSTFEFGAQNYGHKSSQKNSGNHRMISKVKTILKGSLNSIPSPSPLIIFSSPRLYCPK